ncbi:ATP-binding cassette domain-containing protein [Streptomyces sp. NPDC048441]|uniref:ATP-binding cassette domain-containing protein n=1 Tax=Streptomyces sp. NPDC048441 TaxID=3365552 RepID=UPI0037199037
MRSGRSGISLRRARVRYGPLEALHGVTFDAPSPGLTVLLGRNGSGRTTALRALAGTAPLSGGAVIWDGRDVSRLTAHERARRGLCFVPDRQAIYSNLTVRENLELSASARGADIAPALTAYPELHPHLLRRAGTLSGGEQRMVAVSRALLAHAEVILVDEPTQGMSPAVAARTYDLLTALALAPHSCVVTAEQRLPPGLREHAGRTAVVVHELRRGSVVFSGEAAELRNGPPPSG